MPRPKDAPRFAGFASPRYTPTPDVLFDELLPDLSPAELRVLLYIVRRTFGFKKDSDDIGVKQLMSGITTKAGKRLDRGTGLGRSTVLGAVRSLEDWGIIERVENTDPERGDLPSTYRLNFGTENLDGGGPEKWTPIAEKPGPPPSNGLDPQDPAIQETDQETDDQFIRRVSLRYRIPGTAARTLANMCLNAEGKLRRPAFEEVAYKNRDPRPRP